MLIEVESNNTLKCGLLSLQGCITWGLRRVFKYFGEVFVDRFHLHAIKSPREMKHALGYVIFNHAKHCGIPWFRDAFSTGFLGGEFGKHAKRGRAPKWQEEIERAVSSANSWLQKIGWMRSR